MTELDLSASVPVALNPQEETVVTAIITLARQFEWWHSHRI